MTRIYTYMLIGLAFGMMLASCQYKASRPTTQPIAIAADDAIAHSEAAKVLVIDAQSDATPRSKPLLIDAVNRTDKAIASEKRVMIEAAEVEKRIAANVEHYEGVLAGRDKTIKTLTGERDEQQAKRAAAEKLYHDSWFGGKFWRTVVTLAVIWGVLGVVSAVLCASGNPTGLLIGKVLINVLPLSNLFAWGAKLGSGKERATFDNV